MWPEPIERHAVRVLMVDGSRSVLLVRIEEPRTGRALWFPPGGGIEDGEDVETAAKREIAEETGLCDVELEAEIWHRRHIFSWRGVEFDQRERWFLAHVDRFEPHGDGLTTDEKADLKEWRWWGLDELEATGDLLTPRDLPHRLRALLRNGPPERPIEIGI